jgi:hypothetical protein
MGCAVCEFKNDSWKCMQDARCFFAVPCKSDEERGTLTRPWEMRAPKLNSLHAFVQTGDDKIKTVFAALT